MDVSRTCSDYVPVYLQVLSGDTQAAEMLAAEVHRDIVVDEVNTDTNLPLLDLPLEQCGMWIDPIGVILTLYTYVTQHFMMFLNRLGCVENYLFFNQNCFRLFTVNSKTHGFAEYMSTLLPLYSFI